MTTPSPSTNTDQLWDFLIKEISSIQLIWETLERLYFNMRGKGLVTLEKDVPYLHGLMQTALMESLLIRIARLMDPVKSGKRSNVSLEHLAEIEKHLASDVTQVSNIWNSSNLEHVRNKYLAHNDLVRSLTEEHTVNIPLDEADIIAARNLVTNLRESRRKVHRKLRNQSYLDDVLDKKIECEIKVLDRCLMGGEFLFKLLPEDEELWNKYSKFEKSEF